MRSLLVFGVTILAVSLIPRVGAAQDPTEERLRRIMMMCETFTDSIAQLKARSDDQKAKTQQNEEEIARLREEVKELRDQLSTGKVTADEAERDLEPLEKSLNEVTIQFWGELSLKNEVKGLENPAVEFRRMRADGTWSRWEDLTDITGGISCFRGAVYGQFRFDCTLNDGRYVPKICTVELALIRDYPGHPPTPLSNAPTYILRRKNILVDGEYVDGIVLVRGRNVGEE